MNKATVVKVKAEGETKRAKAPQASGRAIKLTQLHSDDVARRAYEIFEREGRPEGRDLEHWLMAEAELTSSSAHN